MLQKKFRIEIWTFSFQIWFKNKFSTLGSGQTGNTCIRIYVYIPFDHFPKSTNVWAMVKKILHTRDTESLDQCG